MENETWFILNIIDASIPDLASTDKQAIEIYLETFAHKEFILRQA